MFHSSIGELAPLEFYHVAVAVDNSSGNVFFVDLFRRTVEERTTSGTLVNEFQIIAKWPRNIAVSNSGELYVVDAYSSRCEVLKYSQGGELLKRWGYPSSEPGGFRYPQGVCLNEAQEVIVVDRTTQISCFDQQGTLLWNNMNTVSPAGRLQDAQAVAIGPGGNIYVADTGNRRIAVFNGAGVFLHALGVGTLPAPVGVDVASDGTILTYDRRQLLEDVGEDQIYKFSANGNMLKSWGKKGREPGDLWEAQALALGPDDTVWVAGYQGHNVVHYDLEGNLLDEWNDHNIEGGRFAQVRGAAVGRNGRVYITDFWNQIVHVFDRYGAFQFMWGERGQGDGQCFNFPRFTSPDADGNIYVSDDREVRKFGPDGAFLGRFGWIIFPGGIGTDSNGNVWVTESGGNRIYRYDPLMQQELVIDTEDLQGGLNSPYGVRVSPNGMVYVADTFNHRVVRLDESGVFDMAWGGYGKGEGQFMAPVGLAIDSQGRVYVSETWGDRIQVFTSDGEYLFGWGSGGSGAGQFGDIYELALDGDYFLYAPDHGIEQGLVHKYALVPDFSIEGKPTYVSGTDIGYFIWSQDGKVWHVRWSSDGQTRMFEGRIHSTSPIVGVTVVDRETMDDTFTVSDNFIDFSTRENNGEDGVDLVLTGEGIIAFDVTVDGISDPDLVFVGPNGEVPTSLPLPLKTQNTDTIYPVGRPLYTPAQDAGYYLWQDADDGQWHLRWSGDSVKTYYYEGTITSSLGFAGIVPYCYEGNDDLVTGDATVSFSGYAGAGEDGIDFYTPDGALVSFDIQMDGQPEVAVIRIGQFGMSPNQVPFILSTSQGSWDLDGDGDVDGKDLSIFTSRGYPNIVISSFSQRYGLTL